MAFRKLSRFYQSLSPFWFTTLVALTSFLLYTCIFALRKSFTVGTYEGYEFFGIDFKVWMVMAQVIGYMLSKFLGIKIVSEMKATYRARGILWLVSLAALSWLGFAVTPHPYNLLFLFLNGLPLGMVWGLVFSYLEGRQTTEILGASLSVSFIFSAGFVKSVGGYLMKHWQVNEYWMPFVVSLLFFIPLLFFLWMLNQVPPPSAQDEQLRTKRTAMSGKERMAFTKTFFPGLALLVLSYLLLTIYRDFRDNFSAEIWISLGYQNKPEIFAQTESIVAFSVLLSIALLFLIKNNFVALCVNHVMVAFGFCLVGAGSWLFEQQFISPTLWMIGVGLGLYFGYIQFNSIFFDRLLAAFRYVGTVGFLIYVADSFGYLGSVSVLLFKEFGVKDLSWLAFFLQTGYVVSLVGTIAILLSLFYFVKKYKAMLPNQSASK